MLSANFKPKGTAAASRGFLATARLSCLNCKYVHLFATRDQLREIDLDDDDEKEQ